jgi:hypothetical protein
MICGGMLILVANVIALPHDCNYPMPRRIERYEAVGCYSCAHSDLGRR